MISLRRSRLGRALLFSCALLVSTATAGAAPTDDEAARSFDEASKAFARGEYRRAAKLFMRAYSITPHGDTAYNAGLSWERTGERSRAAEAYSEALGRELADEARVDAQIRFSRLRRALALVTVTAPEGTEIRIGTRSKDAPAEFFVEPGRIVVHAVSEDGAQQERKVVAKAGGDVPVALDPADAARERERKRAEPRDSARDEAPTDPWPIIGWAGVGTSAVLGGVWFYLNGEANDAREEFNSSDRTDADLRDEAVSLDSWTSVVGISAVVVGATGVAILVFGGGESGEATAVLSPGRVGLVGRF